jgi:phosphoribosylaminoimidazolecarboxamide formyltransferase/IMP cyclohydrolase
MKTVLVSVTDKTGLDNFLKRLERFDQLKLIATTSSAKFLKEQGFACMKVEELTEFPEILSGRVKTLHPRVFAGILARPSQEDRNCLDELSIPEIDIVLVNLYAFEEKLKENLSEAQMIEQIDIGGVSLLRAAAKNFERVAVISDPKQYDRVLESIQANGGKITVSLRKQLAYEALARTASYDKSISSYMASQLSLNITEPVSNDLPASITLQLEKVQDLRYGENPHQAAAWYGAAASATATGTAKFPPYEQLQGKEMSANNITDAFALVRVLRELESPGVCIIKHNNPCGVAVAKKLEEAYDIAYACDPMSAFGGVYGFTEKITAEIANKITANFVEIVLAPDFDKEALNVFSKKKNVRVLRMPKDRLKPLAIGALHVKDLADFGYLIEKDIEEPVKASAFKCVTKKQVDASYAGDLAFTWGVVKHLTSNAIFIARGGKSLGFGIGQTSRIASVNIALAQAGSAARGAVLASDAFFPATDNIESAAKAGIAVIIQPGGSLKDEEVIKACDEHGIAMLFTGQRCFRH